MRSPTFAKLTFGIVKVSPPLHSFVFSRLPYFDIARLQLELSAQDVRIHCGELHSDAETLSHNLYLRITHSS